MVTCVLSSVSEINGSPTLAITRAMRRHHGFVVITEPVFSNDTPSQLFRVYFRMGTDSITTICKWCSFELDGL